MCQEMSMVMATEAYEINKSKTGHPVIIHTYLHMDVMNFEMFLLHVFRDLHILKPMRN